MPNARKSLACPTFIFAIIKTKKPLQGGVFSAASVPEVPLRALCGWKEGVNYEIASCQFCTAVISDTCEGPQNLASCCFHILKDVFLIKG